MTISELLIYPIKSLGGVSVQSALVTDRGLEHDRRWMLVDGHNRFISQREAPQMALFKPSITTAGINVRYTPNNSEILIPFKPQTSDFIPVNVWNDCMMAQKVSPLVDSWFSQILGNHCQLVYMTDDCRRVVEPEFAGDKITSFSDAYPFLLLGQASMDDLNKRLKQPVPVNRFRPNMVFTGGHPFIEDELAEFSINHILFYGVKICARCPIPGINQDTGISGKEPLKTLASYRRKANKIWVGQNLIHDGTGMISVGDVIQVLMMKPAEF